MCGIAGVHIGNKNDDGSGRLEKMMNALSHRGPDAGGSWQDADRLFYLGHKRLSVIDLTETGRQPMVSHRYALSFNGEIYNYKLLRRDLEAQGYRFIGTSDTEVLFAAVHTWGFSASLSRVQGMFAFALWDQEMSTLSLARDRFGEKPLFYTWLDKCFSFASELSALSAHLGSSVRVRSEKIADYLQLNYVPGPDTFYAEVYQLPPGCHIVLGRQQLLTRPGDFTPRPGGNGHHSRPHIYWSPAYELPHARSTNATSIDGAAEQFLSLFIESVKEQMMADVPVGVFLSGGIDSSLLAASMAPLTTSLNTFTVGFGTSALDESQYGRRVAHHFGAKHHELEVTPSLIKDALMSGSFPYDSPNGDQAYVPTLLLSRMARAEVTVCLLGDGGDELFAGYSRYAKSEYLWRLASFSPDAARGTVACLAGKLTKIIDDLPLFNRWNLGNRLDRLTAWLLKKDFLNFYITNFISTPNPVHIPLLDDEIVATTTFPLADNLTELSCLDRLRIIDLQTYLPEQLLAKADRASMQHSLECRCPFLSLKLLAFAFSLPEDFLRKGKQTKFILRKALASKLPIPEIHSRNKKGFGVPIDVWLRGPLSVWAKSILFSTDLLNEVLDQRKLQWIWDAHFSRKRNFHQLIWNLIILKLWIHKRVQSGRTA